MIQDEDKEAPTTTESSDSEPSSAPAETAESAAGPEGPGPGQLSETNAEPGEGLTGVLGEHEGDAAAHIEVAGDPTGEVTNREGGAGTIQKEAKPEDLPSDAKIAPLAEQVNPNAASQAVGSAPTPDEIAGVPQPDEGEKNLPQDGDTSDSTRLLPPDSEQHEDAARADEDQQRNAERGIS